MITVQEKILLTARGQNWLSQFRLEDRENASRFIRALTLVSHSTFLRDLSHLILKTADSITLPVALYAARELDNSQSADFLAKLSETGDSTSVDAVAAGSDLGSEARVAATIRSLCNAQPQRLLNHPNIGQMRKCRCKAIIVVDDLIGSGDRVKGYLEKLWRNRSIRSWWSRKHIQFFVVTYAVTEEGAAIVKKVNLAPTLIYSRICPTLRSLPWSRERKSDISDLCESYSSNTAARSYTFGYQGSAALLVFEHGCPNNVPAILWSRARKNRVWEPLFPGKAVLPLEGSAFPVEIVRRDPISLLVDIGQSKLARQIPTNSPIRHETLLILAYAEKGVMTTGALSFATGLSEENCRILVQQCVGWGLLTSRYRLAAAGAAELRFAERNSPLKEVAPIGEDGYYPKMLRKAM